MSTTCGTRIRAFGDVLRTRPERDGTRRGGEMKPPPELTTTRISDNPLDVAYTNAPLSVSEAADIYITADINWWKVRAGALTRRRTVHFIEGSMNFERNIVNPSAR